MAALADHDNRPSRPAMTAPGRKGTGALLARSSRDSSTEQPTGIDDHGEAYLVSRFMLGDVKTPEGVQAGC
jgi:hypothetical protein